VKDFCRLVINVKYIRGWSVLLSLKKMFIVLREFSFFEPSIHGVNKPESDAGRLKKKRDLQIVLIRPTFLLHKVTFV
jgi:hypothetical protein